MDNVRGYTLDAYRPIQAHRAFKPMNFAYRGHAYGTLHLLGWRGDTPIDGLNLV